MKKIITLLVIVSLVYACSEYELIDTLDHELETRLRSVSPNNSLDYFKLPDSDDLAAIPQGVGNPLTEEKIELGKLLFFETGLAQKPLRPEGRSTYSCGTCHVPSSGFLPGRIQGIADGGIGFGQQGEQRNKMGSYMGHEIDAQGARPLSVLNVAYVTNSMWSGKFGANGVNVGTEDVWDNDEGTKINHLGLDGLESQNIEGLKVHRMVVNEETVEELGYKELFDKVFYDFPEEERYSDITASFALSAYIRSLLTNQAPFQKWLRGNKEALNDREKRGALTFFGKAGCYRCHTGPSLSSVKFYALGVRDLHEGPGVFNTSPYDKRNLGRGGFTGQMEDMFKFKVPQLYNLKNAQFYFHGSSKNNLWGVVEYFNKAIPENERVPENQIAKEFHPLNLSTVEIDELVDFLSDALYDPEVERYVPGNVLSGNCFPNNDPASQTDLGCN